MRLLVLGGTGFVGGATVAEGLRRGWSVTVFNRGLHGTTPPGVHRLRGDRTAPDGLAALAGGEWDLVVDTWDGAPRVAGAAAAALVDRVARYAYVSSGSVYAEPVRPGSDEDAPTVAAAPDAEEADYARNKAGAERAVRAVFGDRSLLARAGLILGPGEDIGRLPWWLTRIARGGDVLAPGPADLPFQLVDARDLAGFLLDSTATGPVNVVSRSGHATMGELLDACVAVTGSDARLRWTDPQEILAAGVEPWNDLPIWIPLGHEYRWLLERDVTRAYAAGLTCRPVAETVADTWAWLRAVGTVPPRAGRPQRAPVGLDPAREAALLAARNAPTA
ncbi:NAD-dependent epimerase/dehydratase family protein [Micromonospora endolithica]|uniref:NAD-dependent epimerase/dehydratase family protein n=1 Tax=Micromonospora endolithica TaxID=230091 RepID=A0A3A9ZLJ7_9ACTN|nr:NAD-dependent epimerase/dehydratase family protein [Micromonospora endolithica]RKN49065.1 NAD-dependent epimerase/dehydratase family protein [Micromonospora endolithica]TWJ23210.1 nucleoside-diphosphate-sugar epimerase [Micromonospora endolithica]